jgi:hypothetical protein
MSSAAPRKPAADALVRDLQRILKPLMAPAAEKAEMLVAHIATRRRCEFDINPKGLADAVRRLRRTVTDDEIREAATELVKQLSDLYDGREAVK